MPGPPLAKRGAPHGHLPPFGRPTGGYGHRLPHWPPYWPQRDGHRREAFAPPLSGHPGRPYTAPPLATEGTGWDAFARPSPRLAHYGRGAMATRTPLTYPTA